MIEEETRRKNLEEEQISLVERLGVAFSLGRIDTQSSEVSNYHQYLLFPPPSKGDFIPPPEMNMLVIIYSIL